MGGGLQFLDILIFAGIAIFLVWKLRSVLGKRIGHEQESARRHSDIFAKRDKAANDAGRLEEIREFTTEELYEALKNDAHGREETEVTGLDADLLELVTEGKEHWASVRFSGLVSETPGAAPGGFAEVWNLVKPVDGSRGWQLAGIKPMH